MVISCGYYWSIPLFKDDAITVKGFFQILSLKRVKRGMDIRFEIPLSKNIQNFFWCILGWSLEISYFELIQYGGFNEIDKNTEECRKLLGDLRVKLMDWIDVSSYKFNGFGVTFDSDERHQRRIGRKKIKLECHQFNNNI